MKWGDLGKFHQICFWSHMIRRFKFVCKAKSDFLISDSFHFLFTFHEYQEPCIHHSRRAALGEAISASWQQLTGRPFKIFLNHQISKTAPKPKMSQKKTGTGSRGFFLKQNSEPFPIQQLKTIIANLSNELKSPGTSSPGSAGWKKWKLMRAYSKECQMPSIKTRIMWITTWTLQILSMCKVCT